MTTRPLAAFTDAAHAPPSASRTASDDQPVHRRRDRDDDRARADAADDDDPLAVTVRERAPRDERQQEPDDRRGDEQPGVEQRQPQVRPQRGYQHRHAVQERARRRLRVRADGEDRPAPRVGHAATLADDLSQQDRIPDTSEKRGDLVRELLGVHAVRLVTPPGQHDAVGYRAGARASRAHAAPG